MYEHIEECNSINDDLLPFNLKSVNYEIVIPSLNSAATIERSILSALAQSLTPKRITIHDNNSTDLSRDIVKRLVKFYSHCSYEFHIKRNSNELIRNIITETNTFRAFIANVIIILKEIIFFIFIFLILLIADVKSTLIIFSLILLFSLLYFSIIKKKVLNKSKINQLYRFLILN